MDLAVGALAAAAISAGVIAAAGGWVVFGAMALVIGAGMLGSWLGSMIGDSFAKWRGW